MNDHLSLAHWRRSVAEIYSEVRRAPAEGREMAWQDWRAARNDLLKNHPQSPLDKAQRSRFRGLPYFEYDPAWRLTGSFVSDSNPGELSEIDLGPNGKIRVLTIGRVEFTLNELHASLKTYWIAGYGGGLFIPFLDKTNGVTTYGGGRYLYDTIRGADLGSNDSQLNMDFNYSYNPSCAYNSRWICPLAPPENMLHSAVSVGEKLLKS